MGSVYYVYPCEGLTEENLVENVVHFPFYDASFDSVTFIASINHIPKVDEGYRAGEAWQCLRLEVIPFPVNPLLLWAPSGRGYGLLPEVAP